MIDMPNIPDFLARPAPTDEQRKRLRRIIRESLQRHIKNPPKRVRKSTRLLGMNAIGFKAPRGA